MPDYRNMSAIEALREAKDASGMTAEAIARGAGLSATHLRRYLDPSDNYSPSLHLVPQLCRVMRNTILLQWLEAQIEMTPDDTSVTPAATRADVLTAVARAGCALGEVQRRLAHEARLALEQKMEEVRPKVVFAESIEVAKTSILVGKMAKLIKQATGYDIGQNRFFEWLRNRGYLHKEGSQSNMPTQRSMDAGWMEIKEGTRIGSSGESHITRTPKITGKGQIYFINLFKRLVES